MKTEYLIDGYNLLCSRSDSPTKRGPGSFERARSDMLSWIAARVEDPSAVTVVFDAQSASIIRSQPQRRDEFGVMVVYARGYPNADAFLVERIREHTHPKQLVVVTDDREVQRGARRRRAVILGCAQFLRRLSRPASAHIADESDSVARGSADQPATNWLEIFGGAEREDSRSPNSPDTSRCEFEAENCPAPRAPARSRTLRRGKC